MDSTEPTKLPPLPFPAFTELSKWTEVRADDAGLVSKLLWTAISKLSTQGRYRKMTPQEIYENVVMTAEEVYASRFYR